MLLFFDTETTGLPANYDAPVSDTQNWPRLVQLAWIVTDANGKELKEENLIIKPDRFTIPKEASDVHGITTERAMLEGVHLSEALHKITKDAKAVGKCVGHNVGFDAAIVDAELFRVDGFEPYFTTDAQLLCTKELGTPFAEIPNKWRNGFKWPNLQELHVKCFNREFDGAHDALADVRATRDVFFHMLNLKEF